MNKAGLATAVTTAALALVARAAPASATPSGPLACGTVITASTRLTVDILGCVGNGLVIGADGITLDLGGHVIGGDGVEDPNEVGISVTAHHDVRIRDGIVQGFYRGIVYEGAPNGTVTSMLVRQSIRRGIVLADGSDGGQIRRNVTADNGASGIAVVASDGATVIGNHSARNIGGAGVRLEGATHVNVGLNVSSGDTLGMQIVDGANENVIRGNVMSADEEVAVEMNFSSGNVLDGNVVTHTGGITIESSDDNQFIGNRLVDLTGDGIGIQIYGNRNLVARNTVIQPIRYGIEVDDFQDVGHSPATDNVIRDNRVTGGALGIAIGPEAGGVVLNTVVQRNRVTGVSSDGIQLLGPSTGLETSVVTGNRAFGNGNYGIAAVPGTIDGGGNRAAGNGGPAQCLNIACR